jgi:hypothetical protein
LLNIIPRLSAIKEDFDKDIIQKVKPQEDNLAVMRDEITSSASTQNWHQVA